MSLRFHEIAESRQRILNPFTEEQLDLLGRILGLRAGMRQLDLACGKGEMLCRWARDHGTSGVGVDISAVFLAAARERVAELGVADRVTLVQGDAAKYEATPGGYDVVSCIGATWIGSGLVGTLALMRRALKPGGLLLVGEPYWTEPPPTEAYAALGVGTGDFVSLEGTLDRIESASFELVEMVLASHEGWDRYEAPHWWAIHDYLRAHPDDPEAAALRDWARSDRRGYFRYGRRYLGWGVFVLREA